ncbi:MAG TPA: helix-turn-helix domain-containing protein [Dehalococcoidia bacterium]|nr:helix-turn-helix domain-containing protein [Dehalococcoidia bacterium]
MHDARVSLPDDDAPASNRLQRATQLFVFEQRESDSPYVERVWRTRSEPADAFISIAAGNWELNVTRQRGEAYAAILGPESRASTAAIPDDAEFFGIQFKVGTFMPSLPLLSVSNGGLVLPGSIDGAFRLHGSAWDLPDYDNAEAFVARLVCEGLLVRDPVVEAAMLDRPIDLSPRSLQRRMLRVTGLTLGAQRQIERALRAVELLEHGVSILETVDVAGYADQAHLTRSLRRFVGQTPAQVASSRKAEPVAFVQDRPLLLV